MTVLLLFALPAAPVASVALAGYGLGTLGRTGLRRAGRQTWLRSTAALLGSVCAAFYALGLVNVALAVLDAEDGGADSSPLRPCRIPAQGDRVLHVVDYTVSYVPLHFVCETNGKGTYPSESVPGYVNPAVAATALAAAACAATAALDAEHRARRTSTV